MAESQDQNFSRQFYESINGGWAGKINPSQQRDRTMNHRYAGYGLVTIGTAEVTGSTTKVVDFVSNPNDAITDFRRYRVLWLIGRTQNDDPTYGQIYTYYNYAARDNSYTWLPTATGTAGFGRNGTSNYNYARYLDGDGFWTGMSGSSAIAANNWGMVQMWLSAGSETNLTNQIMYAKTTQMADGSTDGYMANLMGSAYRGDPITGVSIIAGHDSTAEVWSAGTTFELYGYPMNLTGS